MNAIIDFLETVVKGHWLACACNILDVESLECRLMIPQCKSDDEKKAYVESIAQKIVDDMSIVESSFFDCSPDDTDDKVYNYARVLCHYGSLIMELQDAWREGDGERVMRCWKMALPHFQAANRTKYSLEALRIQFQVNVVLSPNLAHQVKWDRFVNTRGGLGMNVPCDLHNEHVNKVIKNIIGNMGSNLTEVALQRAVRSISTLGSLCKRFDSQSHVPHITSAHSTRSDIADVKKVMEVLISQKILEPTVDREHKAFPRLHFNPLHNWNKKKTKVWIEAKMKQYQLYRNKYRAQDFETASDEEESDNQ